MVFDVIKQVFDDPFLIHHILVYADYDSVLAYCHTHSQAQQIYRDRVFWKQKAEWILNVPRDIFQATELSPAQRYLELLSERGGVTYGSEKYIKLNDFIRRAIRQNRPDLVDYVIFTVGFNNWVIPLEEYAIKGDREQVNHFLQLTQDHHNAAKGAARGGHQDLFDDIIKSAPARPTRPASWASWYWDWNSLAGSAAEGAHRSLLDHILTLNHSWDWSSLAGHAVLVYDITEARAIFDYIRSLVPHDYRWNWQLILEQAILGGNQSLFDYILTLNHPWYWNSLANTAVRSGSPSSQILFDHIRELAPPKYKWDWSSLIGCAAASGLQTMFDHVLTLIACSSHIRKFNWSHLAGEAARGAHRSLFDYIRRLAPLNYRWNWQCLAERALLSSHQPLFDYIFSIAPINYQWNWYHLTDDAKLSGNQQLHTHIISLELSMRKDRFADTGQLVCSLIKL